MFDKNISSWNVCFGVQHNLNHIKHYVFVMLISNTLFEPLIKVVVNNFKRLFDRVSF